MKRDYFEGVDFAVTICDRNGKILDMNQKSKATFLKNDQDIIGNNLLDCHPEPAKSLLANMLQHPKTNVYTIEKNGVKKIIYQTPWYENGEYAGYMEVSIQIPFEMPHKIRG